MSRDNLSARWSCSRADRWSQRNWRPTAPFSTPGFYLDEMPELANAPLGLAILYLIRQTEREAPGAARNLLSRARTEIADEALRVDLVELIATIVIYKLPQMSREEIEAMLQLHDIRETRVYQEAKEEGLKEGMTEGMKAGMKEGVKEGIALAIAKMGAKKMSAAEIAAILEVDIATVMRVLKGSERE